MKIISKSALILQLAPIFFSASFVLTFFWDNIKELNLKYLISPLIIVILFALFFSLLIRFFTKDKQKSLFFASLFSVIFFSYGEIKPHFGSFHFTIAKFIVGKDTILFTIYIFAIIILLFILKRISKNFFKINEFLLLVSFIAIAIPTFKIIRFEITSESQPQVASPLQLPQANIKNHSNLPDIYYIVPEDYASSYIMQKYYGFDMSDFTKFLKDKKFYVPQDSTSNYPKTFLSLASTLNMEYLDYLSKYKKSSDQSIPVPLIQDNNVINFLKSNSYKIYQMGSWWEPTQFNPEADENFTLDIENGLGISQFSYNILKSTLINPFLTKLFPPTVLTDSRADIRRRINYQFDEIPKIVNLTGPKFVFIHIIAPHGPYVLDSNCSVLRQSEVDKLSEETNYTNQAGCINTKLKNTINQILDSSAKKTVILIQSDEGAPFINNELKPTDNWKTASDETLQKKFPIFTAYYLPGVSQKDLYPQISAVNSFRVIFNLYFGTKMSLLPDKDYIFPDLKNLYEFKDVTEIVKNSNTNSQ